MTNEHSIIAKVAFDFRGKRFEPEIKLDLTRIDSESFSEEQIYAMLAKANQIGFYSYEYEVMQSYPLEYSQPQGMAKAFLSENGFDFNHFLKAYQQQELLQKLQQIACNNMQITSLDDIPGLEKTLLEVYRMK